MTKGIVVGVDGSESAALALRFAAAEGVVRDLPVTAVLAWGFLDQHQAVIGPSFDPDYNQTSAAAALRTYLHEALDDGMAAIVNPKTVNDLPARALLAEAQDADLLVVGGRGLGGLKAALLGSVSTQCLHHAPCPVAVVHDSWLPGSGLPSGRIVCAIDGSDNARHALEWAVEEAQATGAQLDVVHVWHTPDAGGYPYLSVAFDPAPFEQSAHKVLAEALANADVAALDPIATCSAVRGHPSTAILSHAKDADLIVLGSRGLGGFKGLLLGSVSQQITQHATCPVVVVRPRCS